jgi:hypothetical protein
MLPDASLRFGLKLEGAWQQSAEMDELTHHLPASGNAADIDKLMAEGEP